ncbi:MAG: hypothetical protein GWN58_52780 [Anaerolineae bacterium]|nr:hypothetical protein [Deltaproteobacteria bacterium]NIV37791.1 hypothetical protein [Anaerolineae bacterium]
MTDQQLAVILDAYREMLATALRKARKHGSFESLAGDVEKIATNLNRAQIVLSGENIHYSG